MCKTYINLAIGIGLVIAGLSGKYVLKGTDSTLALVLVGLLIVVYSIWRISSQSKPTADEDPYKPYSKTFPEVVTSARDKGLISKEFSDRMVKEYDKQKYYFIFNQFSPSGRRREFMKFLFARKNAIEKGSEEFSVEEIDDLIKDLPITIVEIEEILLILHKDKKEHIETCADASVIANYNLGINSVKSFL